MNIRSISAESLAIVEKLRYEPRQNAGLLTTLAETGEIAVIAELLPLAFGVEGTLRSRMRGTIAQLAMPHLPERLPDLDEWLRQRSASRTWERNAWNLLEIDFVVRLPLDSDADVVFAGLCASHWNGRIREAAIARLSHARRGVELPFILWRANDWVAPIAIRARTAVVDRIGAPYAPMFVRCLELVDRLALAGRNDLRDLVASIGELLASADARQDLFDGLRSSNQKIRRRCWNLLKEYRLDIPIDLADSVVHGGDPVVRRLAYEVLLRAADGDRRELAMEAALHDASAAIRYMALDGWIRSGSQRALEMIQASLFDRAPEVRDRARFIWRQRTGREPGPLYREMLPDAVGSQLVGVVYGLGETGTANDVTLVRGYLRHSRARVRVAAIHAAWRLDRGAVQPFVIDTLMHDSPAVAREARVCLERVLPSLDLEALWRQAPPGVAERRLLTMFRQLSKWDRVLYILRALSAEDPDTVAFARDELAGWNRDFNKTYMPLSRADHERLRLLVARPAVDGRDELMRIVRFTIEHS